MAKTQQWEPCTTPEIGDTLKWNEPLWATPNKPRGRRDKIGEQEIIATFIGTEEVLKFTVISVKKTSSNNTAPLTVHENDEIKRKKSSIEKGNCQKLVGECL